MPTPRTATVSGIVDKGGAEQERVIPTSVRADGSVRKERRVRPGFVPTEDVERFRPSRLRDKDSTSSPRRTGVAWSQVEAVRSTTARREDGLSARRAAAPTPARASNAKAPASPAREPPRPVSDARGSAEGARGKYVPPSRRAAQAVAQNAGAAGGASASPPRRAAAPPSDGRRDTRARWPGAAPDEKSRSTPAADAASKPDDARAATASSDVSDLEEQLASLSMHSTKGV